jgi:hypothetical protein
MCAFGTIFEGILCRIFLKISSKILKFLKYYYVMVYVKGFRIYVICKSFKV